MIGPRARAFSAPQRIWNRGFAPGSGCDVSRIWSGRLPVIVDDAKKVDGPPPRDGPRRFPSRKPHDPARIPGCDAPGTNYINVVRTSPLPDVAAQQPATPAPHPFVPE